MLISTLPRACAALAITTTLFALPGCGNLTDKDLIVVAELNGEPIRRGDLRKLIRDMDDEERPIIHNRGDLLRVLNRYVDETLLDDVANELHAEGKIDVPREQATAIYFARNPEDRVIYEIEDAQELQSEEFDVSAGQLAAFKAEIDFKIDDVEQELLRESALQYLAQDALRTGRMTITDEEFQQEYKVFKDRLYFFERVGFVGIRFPAEAANAAEKAAEVRRALEQGTSFQRLLTAYHAANPDLVFESMIENNPTLPQFKQFWDKVTGASVGDIYGPLFLPAHDIMEQLPDGTVQSKTYPAAYVVIQVTHHEPPKQKTWDQAKNDLAPVIVRRKMMQQLRDEYGVEVYEDKLPDPGRYDVERTSPFVDADY